ncbi:MAG: protein kinase [Planctomycetes bacterium]|nr:protein kinase [Planctomycetota bacterium]
MNEGKREEHGEPPTRIDEDSPSAAIDPRYLEDGENTLDESKRAARILAPCPLPGPGRRIGNYEITGEIGRGGMGIVYRARQAGLDRDVALKVLLAGRDASPDEIARFRREARAAAKVHHDHLLAVHDVGQDGDYHYFSMELVEGPSLAALVRESGPLSPRRAATLLRDAARGVAAAHAAGVIHRDLKPSNILVAPDDRAKVADFGLAKGVEGDPTLRTQSQAVLGTPVYMPPEQADARFDEMGPWSDVYSLGATLYEALAGCPPYDSQGTPVQVLARLATRDPVPLSRVVPGTPRDLDTIVQVAMERAPARRYSHAGALAEDLDRFLEHRPIRARPPGRLRKLFLWTRRRPALAAGTLVLALAALVGLGLLGRQAALSARADAATSRGKRLAAAGEFEEAVAAFDEAIEIRPGHEGALAGRVAAVEEMVARASGSLDSDARIAEAEEDLAFLKANLPGQTPEEADLLDRLSRAIGEAHRDLLRFDVEVEAVEKLLPEKLDLAVDRIEELAAGLPTRDRDPETSRRRAALARVASRAFRETLIAADDLEGTYAREIERLRDVLEETAAPAEFARLTDVSSEVRVEAESDDWLGNPTSLPDLAVFFYRLPAYGWTGDQEEAVRALLSGPPAESPARLQPGFHLVILRSAGHLPARFLLPVQRKVKIRVRLRLFRERDVGMPVCHVPRFEATVEDALEPPAPEGSARTQRLGRYRDEYGSFAREFDFFAGTNEVTNALVRKILPVEPTPPIALSDWDTTAWTILPGREEYPARKMTRYEAQRIAARATDSLLPAELRGRWKYDLPRASGTPPGTRLRLLCRSTEGANGNEFLDRMLQRARPGDWPREAHGNQGTQSAAEVGSHPGDLSIHGLHDLEGNVSEWTYGNAFEEEGGHALGGNFRFEANGPNEALRRPPDHREPYIGLRLVLVPPEEGEPDRTVGPGVGLGPEKVNEWALHHYRGDASHGIERDPARAQEILAGLLADHPGDIRARMNLAVIALTQQDWKGAILSAGTVADSSHATPGEVQLARYVRVWATVWDDRLAETPTDVSAAVADLGVLVEGSPRNQVQRILRAYLFFVQENLADALRDLDLALPELFRMTMLARHLGFQEIDEALAASDPKGVFERFLSRWLLAMLDPVDVSEGFLVLDLEVIGRTFPKGVSHNEKSGKRLEKVFEKYTGQPLAVFPLVGQVQKEGETTPAAAIRVLGLLAKLLALTGDRKAPEDLIAFAPLLAGPGPDASVLAADLSLYWNETAKAREGYEKALAASPDHGPARLGLAWCSIVEALQANAGEGERLRTEARERLEGLHAPWAQEAELYRGVLELDAGRSAEALPIFEGVARERPEDGAVWTFLAETRRRLGDAAGAREATAHAKKVEAAYRPLAIWLEERTGGR